MLVDRKVINEINNSLDRGDKKKLAEYLGIMPQALSRHLTSRKMDRSMLAKIQSYIKALTECQAS